MIIERQLDATCIHNTDGPVFLDELDPDRGDHTTEPSIECSLLCAIAEADITQSST